MKTIFSYIIVSILLAVSGFAQHDSPNLNGTFLLQNYSPKEYKGNPQIFDIVQGDRGLMYFSNQKGVFEYDGINWTRIQIGIDDLRVLSLAKGDNGAIYVGANGDFGMLLPDSVGRLQFVSQLKDLGIDSIGRVSQIVIRKGKKYLKTPQQLIIISDSGIKYVSSETEITWISFLDNRFYVLQKDLGLFLFKNNVLELVDEGYQLANKNIISAIRFGNRNLLFSGRDGIFEVSNTGRLLKLNEFEGLSLISAIPIGDDLISLGTNSEGVVVIDKQFNVVYNIGLEKGIIDAAIKTQFIDNEKNLWLGTNFGISKVEVSAPVLAFSKSSGIRSGVESITRFNRKLFVATLDGVYSMNQEGVFDNIGGIEDCYGLKTLGIKKDTLLFAAGLYDVFSVDSKNNIKSIQENGGPYDFKISPLNPNEVIVLHYDGLANLIYKDGKFETKSYRREIASAEPFNFVVQDDGTIWIGTLKKTNAGVFKTHVDIFRDSTVKFERYYEDEGLPTGVTYLFEHEKDIYVATDKGLYKHKDGKFEIFNGFGVDFSEERGVHRINKDFHGNIWMVLFDKNNNYEIGYSSLLNGEYVWNSKMFTRHSEEVIHAMFHEKNGITWLGGPKGLIRYDSKIKNDYSTPFNALIRSVKFGDSLIFGGAHFGDNKINLFQSENSNFNLEYSANTPITFSFSSASFIDEQKTEYSILLEGHNENWSKWSGRTIKEYYLAEGDYSFKVKARNIHGVISEETSFRFKVLPPWYRTTWAYVLYVVGFLFVVYTSIRLSIRRIKQKNIQLEGIVEERTKEVVVQKQDAEKQRDIAEHQKELVEEKNKEIMDSINYAKRLQDAILPPDKLVKKNLPDSFVYYKPKDVVAGDFYWMEILKEGVMFAAADCTGHGVPGALVSVVCSNALDRTVKEFGFTNTGKVLDKVTDLVIETFEKSDEEVKDGMDIALCKFNYSKDKAKASIEFSGANNPIWIVSPRKDIGLGDSVNMALDGLFLHEKKATKQPVGKYADRKLFESTEIELEKDEIFYLFTDGFADQFGGPREKKYKYKPFKKLLLTNYNKSMPEQMRIIDKEFEDWKGDFEQVDDVCVIGVRI